MNLFTRYAGTLGATLMVAALPHVALGQVNSDITKSMGITQKLGQSIPLDAELRDETGTVRKMGDLLKGRPVIFVPLSVKCTGGCHLLSEGLAKTLYRADRPNERKLIRKEGANKLEVGRTLDVVFVSLDSRETATDAANFKNNFEKSLGKTTGSAEPVTVLTGSQDQIRKVTDALGIKFFLDQSKDILRNATGSAILTPDGHISSYTIANDFPTIVLERAIETAQKGEIASKPADATQMFGCIQIDKGTVARREKIEGVYRIFALLTLTIVSCWIGGMLWNERTKTSDLGGQPGGA